MRLFTLTCVLAQSILIRVGGSPFARLNRRLALKFVLVSIAVGENEGVARCCVLVLSYQPPET